MPMWTPKKLDLAPIISPKSNVGQSLERGLLADGAQVCNAVTMVDWTLADSHAEVCDCCGEPGCGGPENISLRRMADKVLVIPHFSTDEQFQCSLKPFSQCPALDRGSMLLSKEQCSELRDLEHGLNEIGGSFDLRQCPGFHETEKITLFIGEPHWSEWTPLMRHRDKFYISFGLNLVLATAPYG